MDVREIFPNGLAGIIYDCDGVMIDSLDANRHFYNLILEACGLPPITPEQERFAFQATARQALEMMLPETLHKNLDQIIQAAVDYEKDVLPKIRLMPGYRKFVETAHAWNLRQAVDSNRTDFGIIKVMDHFHLPEYIRPLMSSSRAEPKPSPQGALMIARDWNIAPDRILFVGDSPDDGLAAKSAGCVFAAFGDNGLDGDIKVKTYKELENILRPLAGNGPQTLA